MARTLKSRVYKSFAVFSKVKILENKVLNFMGVQPFRLVTAKAFGKIRQLKSGAWANTEHKKIFEQTSLLIIHDFLKEDDFKRLEKEVMDMINDSEVKRRKKKYGPAIKHTIDMMEFSEEQYPEIWSYFKNETVCDLFSFAEKRKFKPHSGGARYIEILVQEEPSTAHDVETELHSDTFFDTNKSWLYLTDVELKHAPLVVVPQTGKVSWRRLKNEYLNSISKKPDVSRRIDEKELNESQQAETQVICKANTFVMANTFAYHRRESGLPGNTRIALHISERSNPFKF